MSSTDNRIVKMQFDNDLFKRKAQETKKDLADVNASIDKAGKNKGLLSLDGTMQRVAVSASKMSIITATALATIANKAVNAGLNMAKALTFDPISSGFHEYESMLTKQNVIMNATGKSAGQVKNVLNQLNTYSDKTIYSFGDMTDAITKFVNAGVPLGRSVKSIQGIANAAAYAGASSEEANRAMYAFSQSMSLGFIQLQDWNQIENANMGTVQFKNTLLEAAVAAGTLTKRGKEYITSSGKAITATKGWRDGLQDQWATTEVLNTALGKYADQNTKLGKRAFQAATQVRTFSAFMDTLKESLGSGWSQIFTNLFGGLHQSTKMWTGLSNAIGSNVQTFFNWASVSLLVWRRLGGFNKVLQGFKNILSPIGALIQAIGTAWQTAFPSSGAKSTGKTLYTLSSGFEAATRPLALLARLITGLTPVIAGLFIAIRTGIGAVKGLVTNFVNLVSTGPRFQPLLSALSQIGSYVKAIVDQVKAAVGRFDDLIKKGGSLKSAIGGATSGFKLPKLPNLPSLPDLGGMFGGSSGGDKSTGKIAALTSGIKGLTGNVLNLNKASDETEHHMMFNPNARLDNSRVHDVSDQFKDLTRNVSEAGDTTSSIGDKIGGILSSLGGKLKNFFSNFSFDDLMSSFNLAVLSAFVISMSRMFNTISGLGRGLVAATGGFVGALGTIGESLGGFAKAAKREAMAKIILNLAIAIGIMAAAIWVLSKIPKEELANAMMALSGTMLGMVVVLNQLTNMVERLDGKKTGLKMIALSIAVGALAFAMIGMAIAFKILQSVGWKEIAKGLLVMRVALMSIGQLANLAEKSYKNMLGAALAISAVAGSMLVLAGALLLFKLVDWESMGKAGAALGGITLAVGALALIPYEGISKVGLALLAASAGMLAIANALVIFALVKWESIGKAAVMLGVLTLALAALMFVGNPVSIGGIVSLSVAMIGLATAALIMNSVDWGSIAKIAVVLGALVVAIALLVGVMALAALVGPALLIVGAALALMGVGVLALVGALALALPLLAAGVGAFAAFATGAAVAIAVFMQTLASEAPILKKAFLDMLQTLIDTIVEAVPMIIRGIKDLWNAVKKELQGNDKKKGFADAGESWMDKLKDGIKSKMGAIVDKAKELIVSFLKGLASRAGDISAGAANLIAKLISGIASKMGNIITAATQLIAAFIQGIANQAPKLARSAADSVIKFINSMADAIRDKAPELGKAMGNLGTAMVQGLIEGIGSMFGEAMGKIGSLAEGMVGKAKSILKIFSPSRVFNQIGVFIVQGLTNGIQNNASSAIRAVASMVSGQIAVANEYVSKFIQDLDQKAISAKAKADGLAQAAAKAQKEADKTKKNKKDDKAADKLSKKADAAQKVADQAQAKSDAAKAHQDRADEYRNADTLTKAKMRSEDAQNQLDAAKAAEAKAAKEVQAAKALDAQAKKKSVGKKERQALKKEADALRAQAKRDAAASNAQLANARKSAADALALQKQAGKEAADAFQKQYEAQAKADAEAEAFDKMSLDEKAAKRREDAANLQKKADEDLAKAKKLAYTDLDAANELAQQAMDEADQARQYVDDAASYAEQAAQEAAQAAADAAAQDQTPVEPPVVPTTSINLDPTEAASIAFNKYNDVYDAAVAAAAAGPSVEITQNISSPEPASAAEVYRNSKNAITTAADALSAA